MNKYMPIEDENERNSIQRSSIRRQEMQTGVESNSIPHDVQAGEAELVNNSFSF